MVGRKLYQNGSSKYTRVVLNVTRGNMARQLKEVQDNLTEQVHFLRYLYLRLNEPIQLSIKLYNYHLLTRLLRSEKKEKG